MANDIRFTAAQLRALEWLPADGSWRTKPGRLRSALASLIMYHRNLAEEQLDVGPRGGICWRFRLKAEGIQERARRFSKAASP
jgi:hypothetical protein